MKDHIHIPVLLLESVESLDLSDGEIVVDCTVNRASHSEEFAKKVGKSGKVIIFDLDKKALEFSVSRLKKLPNPPEIISIHSNYRNLKQELKKNKIEKVDKVFADLGLSSEELELSGRGFSFQKDEPLIMTFQSEVDKNTLTAKDLLHNLNKDELAGIFKNYC
jgi:16S rRNA (cytosine1402-N4)-methyltransferase